MREYVATLDRRGRLTLPAAIRRQLGVAAGDQIAFRLEDEGNITLVPVPYPTIASLRGSAGSLPHPMAWGEMRDIAREDHLRAKSSLDGLFGEQA